MLLVESTVNETCSLTSADILASSAHSIFSFLLFEPPICAGGKNASLFVSGYEFSVFNTSDTCEEIPLFTVQCALSSTVDPAIGTEFYYLVMRAEEFFGVSPATYQPTKMPTKIPSTTAAPTNIGWKISCQITLLALLSLLE